MDVRGIIRPTKTKPQFLAALPPYYPQEFSLFSHIRFNWQNINLALRMREYRGLPSGFANRRLHAHRAPAAPFAMHIFAKKFDFF